MYRITEILRVASRIPKPSVHIAPVRIGLVCDNDFVVNLHRRQSRYNSNELS